MCIKQSVGRGGVNGFHDAKTIQILVNLNIYQLSSLAPRAESGVCGASTIAAIEVFQGKVRNMARPNHLIIIVICQDFLHKDFLLDYRAQEYPRFIDSPEPYFLITYK